MLVQAGDCWTGWGDDNRRSGSSTKQDWCDQSHEATWNRRWPQSVRRVQSEHDPQQKRTANHSTTKICVYVDEFVTNRPSVWPTATAAYCVRLSWQQSVVVLRDGRYCLPALLLVFLRGVTVGDKTGEGTTLFHVPRPFLSPRFPLTPSEFIIVFWKAQRFTTILEEYLLHQGFIYTLNLWDKHPIDSGTSQSTTSQLVDFGALTQNWRTSILYKTLLLSNANVNAYILHSASSVESPNELNALVPCKQKC